MPLTAMPWSLYSSLYENHEAPSSQPPPQHKQQPAPFGLTCSRLSAHLLLFSTTWLAIGFNTEVHADGYALETECATEHMILYPSNTRETPVPLAPLSVVASPAELYNLAGGHFQTTLTLQPTPNENEAYSLRFEFAKVEHAPYRHGEPEPFKVIWENRRSTDDLLIYRLFGAKVTADITNFATQGPAPIRAPVLSFRSEESGIYRVTVICCFQKESGDSYFGRVSVLFHCCQPKVIAIPAFIACDVVSSLPIAVEMVGWPKSRPFTPTFEGGKLTVMHSNTIQVASIPVAWARPGDLVASDRHDENRHHVLTLLVASDELRQVRISEDFGGPTLVEPSVILDTAWKENRWVFASKTTGKTKIDLFVDASVKMVQVGVGPVVVSASDTNTLQHVRSNAATSFSVVVHRNSDGKTVHLDRDGREVPNYTRIVPNRFVEFKKFLIRMSLEGDILVEDSPTGPVRFQRGKTTSAISVAEQPADPWTGDLSVNLSTERGVLFTIYYGVREVPTVGLVTDVRQRLANPKVTLFDSSSLEFLLRSDLEVATESVAGSLEAYSVALNAIQVPMLLLGPKGWGLLVGVNALQKGSTVLAYILEAYETTPPATPGKDYIYGLWSMGIILSESSSVPSGPPEWIQRPFFVTQQDITETGGQTVVRLASAVGARLSQVKDCWKVFAHAHARITRTARHSIPFIKATIKWEGVPSATVNARYFVDTDSRTELRSEEE